MDSVGERAWQTDREVQSRVAGWVEVMVLVWVMTVVANKVVLLAYYPYECKLG